MPEPVIESIRPCMISGGSGQIAAEQASVKRTMHSIARECSNTFNRVEPVHTLAKDLSSGGVNHLSIEKYKHSSHISMH